MRGLVLNLLIRISLSGAELSFYNLGPNSQGGGIGGEHQDHLVRPILQVNHVVQGFPAVNSLFHFQSRGDFS